MPSFGLALGVAGGPAETTEVTSLQFVTYVVRTPDGWKHYVSFLPFEHVVSANGLVPEAIVGMLLRPLEDGGKYAPDNFSPNRAFVDFMHEAIARRGPDVPDLQAEARRRGDGWIDVVDQRTKMTGGAVPIEDLVGGFEIRGGNLVPGGYQRNPNHVILSEDGFFQLPEELEQALLEELKALEHRPPD